jgi:hypothetical protein
MNLLALKISFKPSKADSKKRRKFMKIFRFTVIFVMSGFVLAVCMMTASAMERSKDGQPANGSTLVFEDCFGSDKGAASTNKTEHANWARRQSTKTLVDNLASKIAMVFNCTAVSDDQAVRAFAEASGVVARRLSEPVRVADKSCFSNDRGVLDPNDSAHASWARTKKRDQIRDNLIGKIGVALKCLKEGEPQAELFAEISTILARTPGGATGASASDCSGRTYSLAGIDPPKYGTAFSVNWTAPRNHPSNDYIAIYKANTSLSVAENRITWAYLSDPGPCGVVNIWAIYGMKPGEYDVYIFNWGSSAPVSNGVRLVVKP